MQNDADLIELRMRLMIQLNHSILFFSFERMIVVRLKELMRIETLTSGFFHLRLHKLRTLINPKINQESSDWWNCFICISFFFPENKFYFQCIIMKKSIVEISFGLEIGLYDKWIYFILALMSKVFNE